jgi:hypothetical protein
MVEEVKSLDLLKALKYVINPAIKKINAKKFKVFPNHLNQNNLSVKLKNQVYYKLIWLLKTK